MRGHSGSWGREHCSEPGNVQLEEMWAKGLEWQKGEKSFIKELEYIKRFFNISKFLAV